MQRELEKSFKTIIDKEEFAKLSANLKHRFVQFDKTIIFFFLNWLNFSFASFLKQSANWRVFASRIRSIAAKRWPFIGCCIRSNVPTQRPPLPQKNVVFVSIFWQWIFAYLWLKCKTSHRPKCAEKLFAQNSSKKQKLLKSCPTKLSVLFSEKPNVGKISLSFSFLSSSENFLRLLIQNLINCTTKNSSNFATITNWKISMLIFRFRSKLQGVRHFFSFAKVFVSFFSLRSVAEIEWRELWLLLQVLWVSLLFPTTI